ncbi:MAG: GNAT family N-acetyltransferase [Oscillospiraceae bacterium]
MTTITYSKLNVENFSVNSLDSFIRHQEVSECWRKIDGSYVLVPNVFTEEWDIDKRREMAQTISAGISENGFAYGAFLEEEIVGYIYLTKDFFGSENQYIELSAFHISEPYRRQGIGKKLFGLACKEAKALGAKKLYISAHPSKESQAAYRRLGCVEAEEINWKIAENEPYDVQMEYRLR